MARLTNIPKEARRIARESRCSVILAIAHPDDSGGLVVELGFGSMAIADAEFVALEVLVAIKSNMDGDFHDCAACRARIDRVNRALAVLQEASDRVDLSHSGGTH